MKADPSDQLRLLEVQALDLALDQATHRRKTLPELTRISEQQVLVDEAAQKVTLAQANVDKLDQRIKALESDIDQVRAKAARNRTRMDSGKVVAKELASMQHEVDMLATRQTELEDQELELLEQREETIAALNSVTASRDELLGELSVLETAREAVFAEIDAENAQHIAARETIAASLPAELLALYDRIRAKSGGVGAAALRARRCGGCRLELPGTEFAALAAAPKDEVSRCEECGRILIRTKESGL